jgi:hypothetical protein
MTVKAYDAFAESFKKMGTYLAGYEKATDGVYDLGTIYTPVDSETNNPYIVLLDWVRVEILDI